MGHFAQLNDDDAELLSGGKTTPSRAYPGSTNYGQYKKAGGTDLGNPAQAGFTPKKK
jgi:hypothetical protein